MGLKLVATPIGDPGDLTLRAIEALRAAEVVIGEERAEVSKLLKRIEAGPKDLRLLNEHSQAEDVAELLALCRERNVALVSDCGTPGFCDPGARLVAECRKVGVPVTALPGASSLMCLLSLVGEDLRDFWFRGFLPAEREQRGLALREALSSERPVVLMDTPYRLARLLAEIAEAKPTADLALGLDLTQETETFARARASELSARFGTEKREFVMIYFPPRPSASQPLKPPPKPLTGFAPKAASQNRPQASQGPGHVSNQGPKNKPSKGPKKRSKGPGIRSRFRPA